MSNIPGCLCVSTPAGKRHEELAARQRTRRAAGAQGAPGGGDTHH